jgi:hypothetical protein
MLVGSNPWWSDMKGGLAAVRLMVRVTVVLILLHAAAHAGRVWPPPKPQFEQPQITAEQWQALYDEVMAKQKAGTLLRPPQSPGTVMFIPFTPDGGPLQIYYFTEPGLPAHPAMVLTRIESDRKHSYLNLEGYYAGSREAFTDWFTTIERFAREASDSDTIVTIQKWN